MGDRQGGQILRDVQGRARRAQLMERAKAQGAPYGYGYEDTEGNSPEALDALEAYINEEDQKRSGGPLVDRFSQAFQQAKATNPDFGGDSSIIDVITAEAAKMGAEGIPPDQVAAAAAQYNSDGGPDDDDYAFGSKEDRVRMIMDAYNKGARSGQAQRGSSMANDMFKGR